MILFLPLDIKIASGLDTALDINMDQVDNL